MRRRPTRKEIYEALHPETKQYVAGAHAANKAMGNATAPDAVASFTAATAKATGRAERTIRAAAQRGEALARGAADPIFAPFSKRLSPGFQAAVERFMKERRDRR